MEMVFLPALTLLEEVRLPCSGDFVKRLKAPGEMKAGAGPAGMDARRLQPVAGRLSLQVGRWKLECKPVALSVKITGADTGEAETPFFTKRASGESLQLFSKVQWRSGPFRHPKPHNPGGHPPCTPASRFLQRSTGPIL